MSARADWNGCRFRTGEPGGHYESYFQRANAVGRPLGFWIRYTIFSPRGRPADAVGELWAIWFDGEAGRITAVKEVVPMASCRFSRSELDVRIGDATLDGEALAGRASCLGHALSWDLRYTSPEEPLLLLPEGLYAGPFPKAKALVGSPNALYDGTLEVDGEKIPIRGFVGSQNHNWGPKHTDMYAWGQVASFDERPGSFLEATTARVKVGPLWTPWLTLVVLRLDGEEHRLNSLGQALRARGGYDGLRWRFESRRGDLRLAGHVYADPSDFVGLPYENPPGGRKICLNSKIARCDVTFQRRGGRPVSLISRRRAAFEILADASHHGVPVLSV